nr:MAG TPA: hypothetical protein [Caudoviricetes sp.]
MFLPPFCLYLIILFILLFVNGYFYKKTVEFLTKFVALTR